MKKLMIIAFGVTIMLSACNQAEIDRLEADKAVSVNEIGVKNNKINHLLEELNYIADNLQTIREKQGVYNTLTEAGETDVEFAQNGEDRVRSEIEMIDYLMTNNLDRIALLEKSMEDGDAELNQVRKLVKKFKSEVAAKGLEIIDLKEEIVAMEGEYADLMDEHMNSQIFIELQDQQLKRKENEINEVYFVYGSKEELMKNNIIQKKGGVLGVGSVNILKNDFNKKYFTKVDKRDLEHIQVAGKKVEILTEHPTSTYELVKDGNQELISEIRIKNKDEFWAGSHYLVMMTK